MVVAATRIASTGSLQAGPALERRGTLSDKDLQAVDHARSSCSCRFEEVRPAGPVHHVDYQASGTQFIGPDRKCLERDPRVVEADGCAVDHDVGHLREPRRRARRAARRAPRRVPASGSRSPPQPPRRPSAPTRRPAPAPPAPRIRTVFPARRDRKRGAAVRERPCSRRRSPRPRTSACSPRRSPRAASDARSATASAACLCGIVTLTPRKPAAGSARTVSANSSGGSGRRR